MKAVTYTNIQENVLAEWEILWKTFPQANVVNSPAWFVAGCKAFGYKKTRIVAVYNQDNTLVAIAGFVKSHAYGSKVYTVPAMEFVDKQPLLTDFKNKQVTKLLLSEIAKLGSVYLTAVREEDVYTIRKIGKNVVSFPSDKNPYIIYANGSYGDFPQRKRINLNNRAKNAPEKLTMVHVAGDNEQALDTCFEIEKASSKFKHGKAVFDREDVQQFYKLLGSTIPENIVTSILYFGNKPIAYNFGFDCRKNFNCSQKAHLPEYSYYNPGKIVVLDLVEQYYKKEHHEFDFGLGYDRFKMDFTKTSRTLYNVVLSPYAIVRSYIPAVFRVREATYNYTVKHQAVYMKYRDIKKRVTGK